MSTAYSGILEVLYPPTYGEGLKSLGFDLAQAMEKALDILGGQMVRLYKEEITAVDAIDTRFFLDTVAVQEPHRPHERIVKSAAAYSGVVEQGWVYRARGQESYPGRFPAARAIGRIEPEIEDAFSQVLARF
jgi:hypothetical protein